MRSLNAGRNVSASFKQGITILSSTAMSATTHSYGVRSFKTEIATPDFEKRDLSS